MLKKLIVRIAAAVMLSLPTLVINNALAGDISGTILESMDVAGYTYMHVDSGAAKSWVAIPKTKVTTGEKISYSEGMEMKDFYSKSLDRTFSSIVFSPGLAGSGAHGVVAAAAPSADDSFAGAIAKEQQAASKQAPPMPAASGGSSGAVVPFASIEVEKASGDNSYTVQEVFAGAEELNGKTVRLRGKVVKFNANIMGKNWIHLQDGTGDPMKNTHDLVVTTTETVKAEDIIVVEGVVAAKKDFGAGYSYEAIIEDAGINK